MNADKSRLQADLDRRRSNVAQPIPAARFKRPRSRAKQEMREQWQR